MFVANQDDCCCYPCQISTEPHLPSHNNQSVTLLQWQNTYQKTETFNSPLCLQESYKFHFLKGQPGSFSSNMFQTAHRHNTIWSCFYLKRMFPDWTLLQNTLAFVSRWFVGSSSRRRDFPMCDLCSSNSLASAIRICHPPEKSMHDLVQSSCWNPNPFSTLKMSQQTS